MCLESCVVVLNGRQDCLLFGLDEISQKFLMINFTWPILNLNSLDPWKPVGGRIVAVIMLPPKSLVFFLDAIQTGFDEPKHLRVVPDVWGLMMHAHALGRVVAVRLHKL